MGSSTGNIRDLRDKPERISSAAELNHLPPNQYTVMSVLIGPREMAYTTLCETIQALPDNLRLTQSQIDGTLFELVKEGYLTSFMENGDVVYMVQLRAGQRPSKRDEQRLWNKFEMGLDELDIDMNLPGMERLNTPAPGTPGPNRFKLPGLRGTPTPPTARPTPQPPSRPTPGPPVSRPENRLPLPGLQRFNIPGLSGKTDKSDTESRPPDDKEEARKKPGKKP